ncbi:MAG: GtrA family protein [Schleiferilactobacillus perolens]|jgi:putative flippase GtrA|uniref:GtrA family protein n=1 Tax=Schleiferilactobacillus perolens TaxID=100468 RepID=UPI0039E80265|nr:GtrA family protein [Schleiferilactobacillus harbinensis]MCI1911575.1 GtrA family protein [Schleiferilactobacillus harbinensis]
MVNWHALYHRYRHFLRYTFYGFIASAVNVGVYFLFTHVWQWPYIIGNNIAWLIGNIVSFLLTKSLVFHSHYDDWLVVTSEAVSFLGFRLLSLVADNVIMFVGISLIHIPSMWTKIGDQVLVGLFNYATSRWTFLKQNHFAAERIRHRRDAKKRIE